jgi:hypothetical protein
MKKLLTIAFLFMTLSAHAQELDARPLHDLVKKIQEETFTYQGTGPFFGFDKSQSCLYLSESMVIVKNYCFPVKKYPSRGYTIISREFGMIDLYDEELPTRLKHDIQISAFPAVLLPYLSTPFPKMTIKGVSGMVEKLYYKNLSACWATNYSFYTEAPDMACNVNPETVTGINVWGSESYTVLSDNSEWNRLINLIESKIK